MPYKPSHSTLNGPLPPTFALFSPLVATRHPLWLVDMCQGQCSFLGLDASRAGPCCRCYGKRLPPPSSTRKESLRIRDAWRLGWSRRARPATLSLRRWGNVELVRPQSRLVLACMSDHRRQRPDDSCQQCASGRRTLFGRYRCMKCCSCVRTSEEV